MAINNLMDLKSSKIIILETGTIKKINLLKHYLKCSEIDSYRTFNEVIENLKEKDYNIIIIESTLYEYKYLNFVNSLKKINKDLIIVFLSITKKENVDAGFLKKVDLYIERPAIPLYISKKLKEFLENNSK